MDRSLDPLDAAVIVFVVACAGFGLLVSALVHFEVVDRILPLWPLFLAVSAVAWMTLDVWSPPSASPGPQVIRLVAFVCVEALAAAPMVALGWELAGPATVVGAALAAGATCAGLVVFALLKPTTYLEPIDPLIALGIMGLVVATVGLGLGLPLRLVWAVPLLGLTATIALREIASVAGFGPDQHVAGGTRLFACGAVLFAQLLHYFVSMARADDLVWLLLVRALGGADVAVS
ncbi:hypothetical protein [Paraliomyxa miuraensis]|uniref:hypothetical protein n=1 Tax=Paraliomyxa miuraensis TaxID=376150 RepID=UPI00224E9749|nr:hypothetical protein [Paraliomyxa miuraensis]MCX4246000.1 hypothetical protein [Paraliomyxa miuraensis]